jgi:hypothetical protein
MSRTRTGPPGVPTDSDAGTAPILFSAKLRSTAHTPEIDPASAFAETTEAPNPPIMFATTGSISGSPGLALIPPSHLPNTAVNAVKVDGSRIYFAGFVGTVASPDTYDAFVAKFSLDGSKVPYMTKLAGSKSDLASALEIDSAGAA